MAVAAPVPGVHWIDALQASPAYTAQKALAARVAPVDADVRALLEALAAKAAQAAGEWDKSPLGAGFLQGKLATAAYFFRFELPKIDAWLSVVAARHPVCRDMQDAWF